MPGRERQFIVLNKAVRVLLEEEICEKRLEGIERLK